MSSEKTTRVTVPGRPGLVLRGHVTWQEAVSRYRAYLQQQLAMAQEGLAAIEAGTVQVRHQRGIYRVSDVHPVDAPRQETGT
jgi:hypothetical protein